MTTDSQNSSARSARPRRRSLMGGPAEQFTIAGLFAHSMGLDLGVDQALVNDLVTPRPIEEHIYGTLTITFTKGGRMQRPASQDFARRLIGRWNQFDPSDPERDEWVWTDHGILSIRPERVGAIGYTRSTRCGWWQCPADQKKTLAANGYSLGIMRALIDHHTSTGRAVPRYSVAALTILQEIASIPNLSHQEWCRVADTAENAQSSRVAVLARAYGFSLHDADVASDASHEAPETPDGADD